MPSANGRNKDQETLFLGMVVRVHGMQTSLFMARVVLILDVLTNLQFGFQRKSSKGVNSSSIDVGAGNASRRLNILRIVRGILPTSRGVCGCRHERLEE